MHLFHIISICSVLPLLIGVGDEHKDLKTEAKMWKFKSIVFPNFKIQISNPIIHDDDDHLICWVHFEVIGRVGDHISSYCCVNFIWEVQVPNHHNVIHSGIQKGFNFGPNSYIYTQILKASLYQKELWRRIKDWSHVDCRCQFKEWNNKGLSSSL